MKNNFGYYLAKSSSLWKMAKQKRGFGFKMSMFFYWLMSFLGHIFLVSAPIFAIADNNIAIMLDETHDVNLEKAFDRVADNYKSLFIAMLFVRLKVLAIAVFIAVAWVIMMPFYASTTSMIVSVAAGIILFISAFVVIYRNTGLGSVAARTKGISAGDILHCNKLGKEKTSGMALGIFFLKLLVDVLPIAVIAFAVYYHFVLFMNGLYGNPVETIDLFQIINVVVSLIAIFFWVFVFAPISHNLNTALMLCQKDNVISEKTIIVKQIPSSEIKYQPVFDDDPPTFPFNPADRRHGGK